MQAGKTIMETDKPLTSHEVAMGLKEALKVGADTAVSKLNITNGYYLDKIVKIELPPQVSEVVENAKKIPGLDKLIEDVVLQINRSAEDAASQAAPVFKQAITQMTIADAWTILKGQDDAATQYLKNNTSNELTALYQPIMQKSLNKPIVGNISAQDSWSELTGKWNKFAGSFLGQAAGFKTVDVELDEYVTTQALNGLFIKVANEEKDIRKNTNARVTDLLQRVFKEID
jgi:hypothetical protein